MSEHEGIPAAPSLALAAGARVGEFEIRSVIHQGEFGIVYDALDCPLQMRAAVKEYVPAVLARRAADSSVGPIFPEQQETYRAGMRAFIGEARLLAGIEHPALVKVLSFWEQHGTAYMAMPLYEGATLKAWLRDAPQPTEASLKGILAPLLGALEQLHGAGWQHRDVSPDTIMIRPDGKPLLLGFSAARQTIGSMTQEVTVVVKPGYAPLEQYAEDPDVRMGPWTDIYAIAAVVRFAITGKAPSTPMARVVTDAMKPLTECASGYSSDFLAAIDRALSVRPEQRPQSIAEFRRMLGLRDGEASAPNAAAPLQRAAKPDAAIAGTIVRNVSTAAGDAARAAAAATPSAAATADAFDAEATRVFDPARVRAGVAEMTQRFEAPAPETPAQPTSAPPAPEPVHGPPTTVLRRYPWLLWGGALAALVVAAIIVWAVLPTEPERRTQRATAPTPAESARSSPPATAASGGNSGEGRTDSAPPPVAAGESASRTAAAAAPVERADTPAPSAASAPPAKPLDRPPASPPGRANSRDEATAADPAAPLARSSMEQHSYSGNVAVAMPDVKPDVAPAPPLNVGKVRLQITPWGDVYVDGKKNRLPSPPLKELSLPAGRHNIEIRNSDFPAHSIQVEVSRGTSITVAHAFK